MGGGIHRGGPRLEGGDIRLEGPRPEGEGMLGEAGTLRDREAGVEEGAVEVAEEEEEEVLGAVEGIVGLKLRKPGLVEETTGRIQGKGAPHPDLMIQEVS